MPEALQNYLTHLRKDGCFDTIIEIRKAIRSKDETSALVALGELREQISLLGAYIESLEKIAESPKT